MGAEIGERRLVKSPEFGQNEALEEVLEAGNERVEKIKESILKNRNFLCSSRGVV